MYYCHDSKRRDNYSIPYFQNMNLVYVGKHQLFLKFILRRIKKKYNKTREKNQVSP